MFFLPDVRMVPSGALHVTVGRGLPHTLHVKRAWSPWITVTSLSNTGNEAGSSNIKSPVIIIWKIIIIIKLESIPVGCQLSVCQPYVLHDKQVL